MASKKNTPVAEIRIVERETTNTQLVAEAEVVFGADAGVVSGMKLTGITIWKSAKSESGLFVSLPGKKAAQGARYFDFLRPATAGQGLRQAFTAAVLAAYREHAAQAPAAQ
jgi:DNA-binding cell septation regulator SpoVG